MSTIAIFSDSHDNIWNLEKALSQIDEMGVDALLHCGDMNAPFIVKIMADRFSGPIHIIFGNNEGDGRLIQTLAAKYDHVTHHGDYAELELFGRQIAMIHYPEPALRIAQSGQFDLVCYGHDHTQRKEAVGRGWLVNPGELMGFMHDPTWGLYDTDSGEFLWVAVT